MLTFLFKIATMKNHVFAILAFPLLLSLTTGDPVKNPASGTYGSADKSGMSLVLNDNETFLFTNYSDKENPIQIKGSWHSNDNEILLVTFEKQKEIATKWELEKDGSAIRSRKNLCWYRLCKQTENK